jgi:hypothetical protein
MLLVDVRQGDRVRVERWCRACIDDCRRFALRSAARSGGEVGR